MHMSLSLLKMSPSIDFYIFGISNSVEELLLRTSRFDTTSLNTENFLVVTIQIYGHTHTHTHTHTPLPLPQKKSPPSFLEVPAGVWHVLKPDLPPLFKFPFPSNLLMGKGGIVHYGD